MFGYIGYILVIFVMCFAWFMCSPFSARARHWKSTVQDAPLSVLFGLCALCVCFVVYSYSFVCLFVTSLVYYRLGRIYDVMLVCFIMFVYFLNNNRKRRTNSAS